MGADGISLQIVNAIGNFEIAANTINKVHDIGIDSKTFGNSALGAVIASNVIVANNQGGAEGISVLTTVAACGCADPLEAVVITNNNVSNTTGNGILVAARDADGSVGALVTNNIVAAPLNGIRNGIRVDSGNGTGNNNVCLQISGNTSAGSGGATGIGLRKQGTDPAVNVFSINGMSTATGTPDVETYVNSLNPLGGGTTLLSATTGFTECTF
jgi:hypothetical protein